MCPLRSTLPETYKEARLLFVIVCFCSHYYFLSQFLLFAVVSAQVKRMPLKWFWRSTRRCYSLCGKGTLVCMSTDVCKWMHLSHTERVGAVCLLATIMNPPPWIGSSMANTVSASVNIHQLFVYSLCVAFSIISIDGLAASNYISNKAPQWEDSAFQRCLSLSVYTDNVGSISLLKYEYCISATNELLTAMHGLLLAALRATGERKCYCEPSFFLLILTLKAKHYSVLWVRSSK